MRVLVVNPLDSDASIFANFFFHPALQGAARMALQPGAHPAQIKDSVASELS